jgi:hypothetical protein
MNTISAPAYYQLACETCGEIFRPLVATSTEELLMPDWDDLKKNVGDGILASNFREFWSEHATHGLFCIGVKVDSPV